MDIGKRKMIELLVEAHSNELALVNVLQTHLAATERGSYRSLLEQHLRETRDHADRLQRRLLRLGYRESIPAMARGTAIDLIKQGLVLAKGPIDLLRGKGDAKEKMMRNALDEAMTEGLEIGSYDAIESFALAVGDHETAELVADVRLDEERMFDSLRKEIPALAAQVVTAQIPIAERAGGEPWAGYDYQTVDEITAELAGASEAVRHAVRDHESRNKNRSTVLKATEREPVG